MTRFWRVINYLRRWVEDWRARKSVITHQFRAVWKVKP